MTSGEVRDALAAAAQSNFPGENGGELTCWSLVCDQRELSVSFYAGEHWEHPYTLVLGQKDWMKQ